MLKLKALQSQGSDLDQLIVGYILSGSRMLICGPQVE